MECKISRRWKLEIFLQVTDLGIVPFPVALSQPEQRHPLRCPARSNTSEQTADFVTFARIRLSELIQTLSHWYLPVFDIN